ncbi:chromate efflux transporter [Candidatus Binatus soli]|jgi:chromate transporter|uniref:chromate efflux transporter n=1 Tax=Candidatus Binatus soli TaxID=1953413 RepID=UPI003D0A5039
MLKEIAVSFLRLGTTAFGGPAAHIAMMEEEFVRRREWLSHEEFLDMLGATNLIPGPNSTEMAIHIGHQKAGWKGLVVGGVCFIVPAVLIVMAIAWAYVRFGSLPQVQGIMYGIKPVIIAIVLQALWRLAPSAVKSRFLAIIGLIATASALLGVNTLLVLFGAGVVTAGAAWINQRRFTEPFAAIPTIRWPGILPVLKSVSATAAIAPFSLVGLFLFFLKVGAVLYGSGYVLLAFLQADLVDRLHWMTQSQLLDAVAVGQVTPGPVFTTATFIGYLLGGTTGAIVATIGIFVPSFIFVAASRPLIPRIRRSPIAGPLLDGVNVGALALMAAVTLQVSRAALVDVTTAVVAAISALLLIYSRMNSAWLIFAAGLVGFAATRWFGG